MVFAIRSRIVRLDSEIRPPRSIGVRRISSRSAWALRAASIEHSSITNFPFQWFDLAFSIFGETLRLFRPKRDHGIDPRRMADWNEQRDCRATHEDRDR